MAHDLDLICTFLDKSLNKEPVIINSSYLRAHNICDNNQLFVKNEGLLASSHLVQDPHCFLVKLSSPYWQLINKILLEKGFIPNESKGNTEFYTYQYSKVPPAYEVNCTSPNELWRKWWIQRNQKSTSMWNLDFLIRTRSEWYPVRDIEISNHSIFIQTLGQKIRLTENDVAVWLHKARNKVTPKRQAVALESYSRRKYAVRNAS
ncbi:hypothetical protein [Leptothoe kymatousa]|uniref:Homing endonuclease LAGLIDADG domain-containing protein n=1 Tax=Leptothoe kymatousa TAU-MAC 1615 TaxID=2364775 RepID=A0ABS5Y4J0_9CYAN|nr:hypothetical protein [Leptothoe kymatousa]MBT9312759.1 hypothetical protein [Leptothoe kymatousa TAU-MAC 1615]